jgi:hypothetical protein
MVWTLADGTQMTRRKRITVTGNLSGAQTDYQIKLAAVYAAAMQSDFDDLRFVKADMQTLIDAWLESKVDDTSAAVWVEFPTTPANTVEQTYYMYYGKVVANYWDGDATFQFFDDFEDASFTTKWNDLSVGNGIVSESGGKIRAFGNAGSGDNTGIFESKTAVVPAGYRTDIDVETVSITLTNLISIDIPSGIGLTDGIQTVLSVAGGRILRKAISSVYTTLDSHTLAAGEHIVGMLIDTDGTCRFWLDDVEYNSSTGVNTSNMYLHQYCRRTANTYWLLVKTRKYAANPPTYAFGSEEHQRRTPQFT